jgi:two-component system sensor histidine kinase/response regulator
LGHGTADAARKDTHEERRFMTGQDRVGIVDWDELTAQFRGREASVARIAATVLRTQGEAPAQLRELAARRDFEALSRLAHSLKGMGGNIMAQRIFELGRAVDTAAREQSEAALAGAEELARAVEEMLGEMRERIAAGGA